jgi:hypothetical protein
MSRILRLSHRNVADSATAPDDRTREIDERTHGFDDRTRDSDERTQRRANEPGTAQRFDLKDVPALFGIWPGDRAGRKRDLAERTEAALDAEA